MVKEQSGQIYGNVSNIPDGVACEARISSTAYQIREMNEQLDLAFALVNVIDKASERLAPQPISECSPNCKEDPVGNTLLDAMQDVRSRLDALNTILRFVAEHIEAHI